MGLGLPVRGTKSRDTDFNESNAAVRAGTVVVSCKQL